MLGVGEALALEGLDLLRELGKGLLELVALLLQVGDGVDLEFALIVVVDDLLVVMCDVNCGGED